LNPRSFDIPMTSETRYLIISPCRNEAEFMRQTLDSVVAQSIRPTKWVIVDDGSTDATPTILAEYAAKHAWIQIVTRSDRGHRAVGPGVIDAFYSGYEAINVDDYDFICKLDLDLIMPPRYFELLMARMHANPKLATVSGKAYIHVEGQLVYENHGDENSIGAAKFFKVSCFKHIGGFVREVGWDGIDGHMCRMNGWVACSWDEPELRFIHLRPMGSSHKGIYTGRYRAGYGQYYMGTGFLFILASVVSRLNQKPYVLGQLTILWGWIHSAILGKPRYPNEEFRRFLQRYQMRALIVGKRRAIAEIDRRNAA
jgi:glycosyltransferase involved in cell wall biosynthesis